MAAPAESSGAGRALGRQSDRPRHLMTWTTGVSAAEQPELIGSPPSDEEFSLDQWVATSRDGSDDAVVAAIYPNALHDDEPAIDWVELTRVAAGFDPDDENRRVFTGDTTPTSLRALRLWATEQLAGRQCSIDDVVLALSELSTNVERHATGWLTVDLVENQGLVVVAVTDPSVDRLPVLRSVGPEELTGRGLLVVASLAVVWGVVVRASSKTVWAAFPCT
ncbi:hypothetical protein BH10ACT3_BH10ACT3_08230 [soil metagenome]